MEKFSLYLDSKTSEAVVRRCSPVPFEIIIEKTFSLFSLL